MIHLNLIFIYSISYKSITIRMAGKELSDLIGLMALESGTTNTTNNWDVLTSYGIEALNKSLLNEFSKNSINNVRVVYLEEDPFEGKHLEIEFILNFDLPQINFTSKSTVCHFMLPIDKSSKATKNGKTINFPQGYFLSVEASLDAGEQFGEKDFKSVLNGDGIYDAENKQVYITLNFDLSKSILDVTPKPKSDEKDSSLLSYLLLGIRQSGIKQEDGKSSEFKYSIIQIVPVHGDDEFVLVPKSFMMTTKTYPNGGEVLHIWIQTNRSNNKGIADPRFIVSQGYVSPIPNGYNASVIFSRKLIRDIYLKETLSDKYNIEATDLDLGGNKLVSGINLFLRPKNNSKFTKDFSDHHPELSGTGIAEAFDCTVLDIDFDKTPLLFSLASRTDGDEFSLLWKWSQQFDFRHEFPSTGDIVQVETGKAKVSATINKALIVESIDNSKFSLSVHINEVDIVTKSDAVEEEISGLTKFLDFFTSTKRDGNFNVMHETIKSLVKSAPKVDINLAAFNYFCEANILFNEKRFSVKKTSDIKVPNDLMIVGYI